MTSPRSEHPFDRLVVQDETAIRVAEAALLFATDHCPDLDVGRYLRRLDELAERVGRLAPTDARERIQALREILVAQEGFHGNTDHYYDPRNSFLNDVIDRRTGIPITLSVIWLDIAGQLDWPLFGAALPGHFILRYAAPSEEILIDPFSQGRLLTRAECQDLVSELTGYPVELRDEHFAPSTTKLTLTRMLNNLAILFLRERRWPPAVRVLLRLLALHPDSMELRRQLRDVHGQIIRMN